MRTLLNKFNRIDLTFDKSYINFSILVEPCIGAGRGRYIFYYYMILITMKHSDRNGIISLELEPITYFDIFTQNIAV